MTPLTPDLRLPRAPWVAVCGEIITALCLGCQGLFLPMIYWAEWPELLVGCHYTVGTLGTLALAPALARRKPAALKAAVALAGYIGLPTLLTLEQTLAQIGSVSSSVPFALSYAVMWAGLLGQAAVLWSCLGRLTPAQPLEATTVESENVGLTRE